MSATARDLNESTLAETIHHEPAPRSSSEGNDPMPRLSDKSGQRYTYSSGARPLDGFTIKRAIGRGGFGEVYYATSDAGKEVALKLITRNLEVERRGVVQCMNLKSPNLVAIHDMKQNDEGDSFVIMEYVAGPSLAQILLQNPTGLPPAEVRMWLKGLVEGVAYLHDHGIVHRDLKPANLFLEEGVVKIGDYGLSKAIASQSRDPGHSECVGTCHYMAPETSTGKYHKPIDIYAIGVILHEMVTGRVPFDGESVGEVLMKHLTSRADLGCLPEPFKGIVARALAKDPNHRPAKVTDLLLPGDLPQEPAMRFLGEKSWQPTLAEPVAASPPAIREDVLRIEAEDPVFYIGPETRPTRPATARPISFNQWLWGQNKTRRTTQAKRVAPPRRVEKPRSKPRVEQAVARPTPVAVEPVPLGPPPAWPSGRVRMAELTGSMILATPLVLLGSSLLLPLSVMTSVGPRTDPRQMAVVFGMALLTSWTFLAAGKFWEWNPQGLAPTTTFRKQLLMAFAGIMVGLCGLGLADATHTGNYRGESLVAEMVSINSRTMSSMAFYAAIYASYTAVVFAVFPWWKMTARNRGSRFPLMPIVYAGGVSTLLGALFEPVMPIGPLAVSLGIVAAQWVSPWSREARQYKRLVQDNNRLASRKVA